VTTALTEEQRAALEGIATGETQPATDPIAAAEQLAELLRLPSVGLSIRGARIVGRGARASADVYLSDGSVLTFETLRDVGTVNRLALEVAACTGALPKLKGPQALQAVALIRAMAEHEETFSDDQIAREWGATYLQAATAEPVDLEDQADRWRAFSTLERVDPVAARWRGDSPSIAAASLILVARNGARLVRSGWFRAHVRGEENVSAVEVAQRMLRVGWRRRGATGRIKASRVGHAGQLAWSFYEVPPRWEDDA
jgi:hypothetical protein